MPPVMRRPLWTLAILLLLVGGAYSYLQGAVPLWASAYVARQLDKAYSGTSTVRIQAYPFWKIFLGRFDRLELTGHDWRGHGQEFARVHLVWYQGAFDMGELAVGVLKVSHQGVLAASATVTQAFLARHLPPALLPYHPTVTVTPAGVTVRAAAEYAGLRIPLALTGTLAPASGGEAVAFVPTRLAADGYPLPLPAATVVFHLRDLALPKGLHLFLRAVHLGDGTVTLLLSDQGKGFPAQG